MKTTLITLLLAATLFACTTPQMALAPSLKNNSETMAVKGKQGLQIRRTLSFGNYSTSKVKQGWLTGYDIPFILRFQGMQEKISFQQFGTEGQVADVFASGKFRSTELPLVRDHFDILLKEKNHFAGSVVLNQGRDVWEFLLYNPDGKFLSNAGAGFIKGSAASIDVKGVTQLENGNNYSIRFVGYEFVHNGEIIGAVETINKGKVWMKSNLDEDLQLVLASLSSCLLLRTNLEESVDYMEI
ncbi:MAG: hypothetical protein JXR22_14105 [Prolixibacteraceae bacterium]|nr:hypothetical protein [Prolixibacteraceae bacterium]